MAGPIFSGDPLTGSGFITYPDGTTVDADLAFFTGGRFYISNGALIDTTDLMNPLSIGRQGPFTMTEYQGGRYNLISQTTLGQVNRPISNEILKMVSGSVDVVSATGDIMTFNIDPTPVTHIGYQWTAYPRDDGTTGYASVRGPFTTNAEVEAAYGAGFRLATGEEAAYAAIFKRIVESNRELLNRYIDEQGITGDEGRTAESIAVAQILELGGFSNFQSFSSYLVE